MPRRGARPRRDGAVGQGRSVFPVAGDAVHPANFGRPCSMELARYGFTVGLEAGGRWSRRSTARLAALGRRCRPGGQASAETIARHGRDSVAFYVSASCRAPRTTMSPPSR
ncbi:hypothetical protein ACRAWD_15430 [Caulobacter segnis]